VEVGAEVAVDVRVGVPEAVGNGRIASIDNVTVQAFVASQRMLP
jgi:hypothetical protein